jgi:hypothetical protein
LHDTFKNGLTDTCVGACNHRPINSNAFHPTAIQMNLPFDDDQSEIGKISRY